MQLKHIKLSGFKSFVDPTRISFPSNMVAVVGPNGCGKSNVIDAVRWVLGELSAKNLRGESMTDVIFNGTDSRKPSGQCSVELLFDNSLGKLGGEYAKFNEISVKRSMTRDGQSKYSINNTNCRRKDIQDIFLGTGLGPRSYAIIEQGMVSKIVGARPEELRVYIEEAAGTSKYKERKKETEQKIKSTKENLSRVNDIRDEIKRLISRLEKQSKQAQKYQELTKEEKQLKLDLAIINMLEAKSKKDSIETTIVGLERDIATKNSQVSTTQAKIDQIKLEHKETLDAFDEAQKEFYTHQAEIARYETKLENQKKSEASLKEESSQLAQREKEINQKVVDFEALSPREKAIHLLDKIINGIDNQNIKSIAIQLRELLIEILNIAESQSETIKQEIINRKNKNQSQLSEIATQAEETSERLSSLAILKGSSEAKLNQLRAEQSNVDEQIRTLEGSRGNIALDIKALEEKLNDQKLERRTFEVNLENANQLLIKNKIDFESINQHQYADMNSSELADNLASIQSKIISMGAINLAAPEEIEAESSRLEELNEQTNDLEEALEKLQVAIKKIDAESKAKFETSFNAVNEKLKELFPILFGGGKAELVMVDANPLDSGIAFMATPPGKKNSTISQLSGGEKALTALSLVFALFELNPAPFCMLDEVDAPLDDLNTFRFVEMVEKMSSRVQFIFITHNKISMEKSDHLMGVTMQEAGVSRLVSVNVSEALEMAAS